MNVSYFVVVEFSISNNGYFEVYVHKFVRVYNQILVNRNQRKFIYNLATLHHYHEIWNTKVSANELAISNYVIFYQ